MSIETRPLGRTGADVTILGYGAMELRGAPRGPAIEDEEAGRLLNAVLDGGINLIDTSPDYGRSEELIGRYVGHRRDEYFLASKCGCPLGSGAECHPALCPRLHAQQNIRGRDRAEPQAAADGPPRSPAGAHVAQPGPDGGGRHRRHDRCRSATRERSVSSACRGSSPTCPTTSRWASSTSSRSPTRWCSASTRI